MNGVGVGFLMTYILCTTHSANTSLKRLVTRDIGLTDAIPAGFATLDDVGELFVHIMTRRSSSMPPKKLRRTLSATSACVADAVGEVEI